MPVTTLGIVQYHRQAGVRIVRDNDVTVSYLWSDIAILIILAHRLAPNIILWIELGLSPPDSFSHFGFLPALHV